MPCWQSHHGSLQNMPAERGLPLVSCIMPTANRRQFVPRAIRYFQAQTYPNLQVLIGLDGPDAACERIVSRFLTDSRFQLVVQPKRLGWFGNLNWLMDGVPRLRNFNSLFRSLS